MMGRTSTPPSGGGSPGPPFERMVPIPGGTFLMGSNDFYPEERPVHRVTVDGFWMDEHPVTNAGFRDFVEATGYTTLAERQPDPADYPGIDPALLVPGSLVFRRPPRPVGLRDYQAWWAYMPGACWDHPEGPESTLDGRDRHPVVHVAYEDAEGYARWAGKELPTEAEWEFAARGGLEDAVYVWGDEFAPEGRMLANTWQGEFPWQNLLTDGYEGTSPVGAFAANGYGLYDVAGNVWEWTGDFFTPRHPDQMERAVIARMQERRRIKKALEERASELKETLGRPPLVRAAVGEAADAILEVAAESAEPPLVAVGTRGLGLVDSVMLGSVSRKVLRAASGPVLIAP